MNNVSIRLQQARKGAGLSLRGLADLVQLSHAAIKKYEDGIVFPSSEMLDKLSKALHVQIEFFFRPLKVSIENIKFRKRKKLSVATVETIKFDFTSQIEQRFELENLFPVSPVPRFELPSKLPKKINHLDEIERIAEEIRTYWKLGLAPLPGLIDALESRGVRVFIVDIGAEHFDGLTTTVFEEPIIVINSKWPGDRQRFTLAHELGHYILADRLTPSIDEEFASNRFAGAFLLPRDVLFQTFGKARRAIVWQELLLLKYQFKLSMGAICHRLHDLGIIEESRYKNLVHHFRKLGWHLKEPGPELPQEKGHAYEQLLFRALAEELISETKAAELLSCSLS